MADIDLLTALRGDAPVVAAELRPPRAELESPAGRDAWIDTYHVVRRLTRDGTFVFLTDSAVGAPEEDNLRHLIANLGRDVHRERVVPFLTAKHSLEYCFSYTDRARQHGFKSLVVLGGDKAVGPPRVVPHAWELRQLLRSRDKTLAFGGWANPNADPERQIDYLLAANVHAEFFLTQIVSHHAIRPVDRFLTEGRRRGLTLPGMFGVFFYRSANPRTLEALSSFMPVPAAELTREFEAGATPAMVCARSIRALADAGARHVYVSNLPLGQAPAILAEILREVGTHDTRQHE